VDPKGTNVVNGGGNVARKTTTPWELLESLDDFEVDKDPLVTAVLDSIKRGSGSSNTGQI